jgi:hypothetical protein
VLVFKIGVVKCAFDGVSTYSCNISATGVKQNDKSIQIVALACAKDEGLGQTYELIREERE